MKEASSYKALAAVTITIPSRKIIPLWVLTFSVASNITFSVSIPIFLVIKKASSSVRYEYEILAIFSNHSFIAKELFKKVKKSISLCEPCVRGETRPKDGEVAASNIIASSAVSPSFFIIFSLLEI